MSEKQLMTPNHELWDEFYQRLEGPEGCNFRNDDDGKTVWSCDGDMDKPLSRAILKKYKSVDIESTLQYFESHGGYCDCEVLFNVK
jgi:hypothetical protein